MPTFLYSVHLLFVVYSLLLLVRILGSWFPQFQDAAFFRFIRHYTDPYLNLFRRWIPPLGMIDFSPVVAIIALQILEKIVMALLLLI